MIQVTVQEEFFISVCLEGFFYGLYSGIFVIYLQCSLSNKSWTTIINFHIHCLLYVLSTATFVCDLIDLVLEMLQLQIDSESMLFHLSTVQIAVSGCSCFIAQCIMIYRCWIVWGKNIRVVIIPSILTIAYLVTWLAQIGATTLVQDELSTATWADKLTVTGLAASMAVNALVTGLIVYKILKVFLEVMPTPFERTLGSLSSTGCAKLQHIIFIIIESAMVLFVLQLVRIVFAALQPVSASTTPNFVVGIYEMFNGIAPTIILVRVFKRSSFDDEESFKEAAESLCFDNNTPSERYTIEPAGSSSSLPVLPYQGRSEEESEDTIQVCFKNPSNDPNDGCTSSTSAKCSSSILSAWPTGEE